MKICMVSYHGCLRVFKEAYPLIQRGYKVDLISHKLTAFYNVFNTATVWGHPSLSIEEQEKCLRRALRESNADIYHYHNEPDWPLEIILEEVGHRAMVIWDIHDLESLRFNATPHLEMELFKRVDGVVQVGEAIEEYAKELHSYTCPSVVVKSLNSLEFIVKEPKYDLGGIVYEGGIGIPTKSEIPTQMGGKEKIGIMNFRNITNVVKNFCNAGYPFHIYPAGTDRSQLQIYEMLGAKLQKPEYYPDLLNVLSRHKWGFVGTDHKIKIMQMCMPNKLFEYLWAGLPIVVYNAREVGKFVEKHKIGVWIKDLKTLPETMLEAEKNWEVYRRNVMKKRMQWTMDEEVNKLQKLYITLLNKRNKKGKAKQSSHYNKIYSKPYNTSDYTDLFEIVANTLPQNKQISILDNGCGTGDFTKLLYDKGYKSVEGLDFSSVAIEHSKKKSPHTKFHLNSVYDLNCKKYKVIAMLEVLEHLDDDIKAVDVAKSRLRKDGFVIASVPNNEKPPIHNGHLRSYNKRTVKERFGNVEFISKDDFPYIIFKSHK